MKSTLRLLLAYLAFFGAPVLLATPAMLWPLENWIDKTAFALLWLSSWLGTVAILGVTGFWHWAVHGPKIQIIIPRPCRCGMAFPAQDGLYHLVVREDDFRLRLACTGEGTGHRAFYVTGRKGRTIGDVLPGERCPRPGCSRFEEEIHPACPAHGRHRNEPV